MLVELVRNQRFFGPDYFDKKSNFLVEFQWKLENSLFFCLPPHLRPKIGYVVLCFTLFQPHKTSREDCRSEKSFSRQFLRRKIVKIYFHHGFLKFLCNLTGLYGNQVQRQKTSKKHRGDWIVFLGV